MKYYAVLGQEQMFYGLHGMSKMEVITANDFEEASRYAEELSYEVIDSYSQIQEEIEEDVEVECIFRGVPYTKDSTEVEWIRDDLTDSDLDYYAYELDKELLPSFDIEELNRLLQENDWEYFIMKYAVSKPQEFCHRHISKK